MAWALIVTEVCTLPVGPAAVAAPPSGAVVLTSATAQSPIARDAHALVDVTVRNPGTATASAPVVLTVTGLPAGASILRADTDVADKAWECSGTTCTLVQQGTSTPVPLDEGETVDTRVRIAGGAGAPITAPVVLTAAVTAGPSSPPADLSAANATVTVNPLAAGQLGSIEVVANTLLLVAGQPATATLAVTALGPVGIGGTGAPLTVTGLLPVGSTAWSASGTGWTCTSVGGLPRCTWTGSARAVGTSTGTLTVNFTAPVAPTASGQQLAWTRTVSATPTGGGAAMVRTDALVQSVLADQPPSGGAPLGP